MNIYDRVKELLEEKPELRDNDNDLIFNASTDFRNAVFNGTRADIVREFKNIRFESCRRSRQKVQELHPELRGSKWVQKARAEKAEEKGTWVYREWSQSQKEIEQFTKHIMEPKQESLI